MSANRLEMNSYKTDFIWLGSRQQLAKIQCHSIWSTHFCFTIVTCLWVQFDSQLTFTPHIQCLARHSFHHLRQLRRVRKSLTTDSAKTLVHAFTAGRLDYCNSVQYQINTNALKTLQSVLHLATQLILQKWKFDHITPTLRDDLQWLPVLQRITYKLCTIVYKCLHQSAPQYLQELCVPVTNSASRRHLHSAARGDLQVLATRTVTYGPACAPKLWNSLLTTVRHSTLTMIQFCSRLKTHLFGLPYGSASWLFRLL